MANLPSTPAPAAQLLPNVRSNTPTENIGSNQGGPQIGNTELAGPQPILYPPTTDYVLLCVEAPFKFRQRLGWVVLPPQYSRRDGYFFRHAKREYRRLRPWKYAIFTFRSLCFFKFVKVQKPHVALYLMIVNNFQFRHYPKGPDPIFCFRKQELPAGTNSSYHTIASQCNPPLPPPPIDPDLMNHLYRHPESVDHSNENLELIPKRVDGPLPNYEEVAWGLQAVEGPNGILIFGMIFMLMAIAGWFVGWWVRKNPQDLQSATIVFTLLFPLLTLLVAVPRYMWARVWDLEEGRGINY